MAVSISGVDAAEGLPGREGGCGEQSLGELARGQARELVDEDDRAGALEAGELGAAALDQFGFERRRVEREFDASYGLASAALVLIGLTCG